MPDKGGIKKGGCTGGCDETPEKKGFEGSHIAGFPKACR